MPDETMNKERWVALFREVGLDDAAMNAWHRAFESRYPDAHQRFLEWLGVEQDEIRAIRAL